MDLGDISIMWPKVVWPDIFTAQDIIAFSISTCSIEEGQLV